jgi:hypothetical protein
MGDTDSPDFNKARGYLIGYSVVVLLLWYFGADLSSFKLLGNEIKLNENVENVWLVLALINLYLCLRLYHRMPAGSFRFDMAMHELYNTSLINLAALVYKRRMREWLLGEMNDGVEGNPEIKMLKFGANGRINHLNIAPVVDKDRHKNTVDKIQKMSYSDRNQINFTLNSHCSVNGSDHYSHGKFYLILPHRLLAYVVKFYVFVKGALLSPWFADHIVPLILGVVAVCVALYRWWQMNHVVHVVFKNSFNQILMSL